MSKPTIEDRLKVLEAQVRQLADIVRGGDTKLDWRSTVGMFSGDEFMKRVDEHARKFREAERRKAARQRSSQRHVKP